MLTRGTIALAAAVLCLAFWTACIAENHVVGPSVERAIIPTATAANSPTERQIKKKVEEDKLTVDSPDMPIKEAMDMISDKHRIPIIFDNEALKSAAFDPTANPVGMPIKDLSLRSALNLILGQYNLTYLIKDEVLQITTTDKANTILNISIYDVRDLVSQPGGGFDQTAIGQLMTVITTTIAAPTWATSSGMGTVQPFSNGGICVLVVSQTQSVHEEIEKLLGDLRTFMPKQEAKVR